MELDMEDAEELAEETFEHYQDAFSMHVDMSDSDTGALPLCGSTMERSGMGCSSLICRALAGAAWSPSKVGTYKSINIRSHPPQRTPRSKTIEKVIAFAICLPTKIDASRFSGPEKSRGVHFLRQT